jgi:hypothetical protein
VRPAQRFDPAGYFVESYWAEEAQGLSIIAHIWRPYPIDPDNLDDDDVEQKGPIATQKCYWYFGNLTSIAFDRATGLETFGLESPDDVNVHITLEDRTVFRLPYVEYPYTIQS